ncbi:hypothetical protein OJ253_1545 [Cryptosporidium canis]|uniref:Uncharacterized protein n=1 Tax=Cryptosporidium canis TaxID=195482 RepID=A0A9D5DHC5_9CRYT|nr:hypothetical protein OJ253_1545 [Cryptosporidium canis]
MAGCPLFMVVGIVQSGAVGWDDFDDSLHDFKFEGSDRKFVRDFKAVPCEVSTEGFLGNSTGALSKSGQAVQGHAANERRDGSGALLLLHRRELESEENAGSECGWSGTCRANHTFEHINPLGVTHSNGFVFIKYHPQKEQCVRLACLQDLSDCGVPTDDALAGAEVPPSGDHDGSLLHSVPGDRPLCLGLVRIHPLSGLLYPLRARGGWPGRG